MEKDQVISVCMVEPGRCLCQCHVVAGVRHVVACCANPPMELGAGKASDRAHNPEKAGSIPVPTTKVV